MESPYRWFDSVRFHGRHLVGFCMSRSTFETNHQWHLHDLPVKLNRLRKNITIVTCYSSEDPSYGAISLWRMSYSNTIATITWIHHSVIAIAIHSIVEVMWGSQKESIGGPIMTCLKNVNGWWALSKLLGRKPLGQWGFILSPVEFWIG